jgi:hypothetical protein
MKNSTHVITLLLLLVSASIIAVPRHALVTNNTILVQSALETPSFLPPTEAVYENNIIFGMFNPNPESETEIFRSSNQYTGFELIATVWGTDRNFVDRDLKSNTTFYYKLRAMREGEVSAYSETISLTSGYKLYAPALEAIALNATTVQLRLTDRSYNDTHYDIWRTQGSQATHIWAAVALDSGQILDFIDEGLNPLTTYTYRVDVSGQGSVHAIYYGMTNAVVTTLGLEAPRIHFWSAPDSIVCGNHITMVVEANNDSYVDIYRSLEPENGFEYIYTTADRGSSFYTDEDLLPRTVYYYKAIAFLNDATSDFSPVVSARSGSGFYNPVITAKDLGNRTVEIKLEDRSFLDDHYEIVGVNTATNEIVFSDIAVLSDSGAVYTAVDPSAEFNNTYRYFVNATLKCYGAPGYANVASDTVTVLQQQTGPLITSFTLVDPYRDEDVYTLHDYAEFESVPRFNIRANANEKTRSVQFFLNGKRFGEKQVPYALYGDKAGDYHPGRLKPGFYTLTATAFGKNQYNGEKGNTLTIHFTVLNSKATKEKNMAVPESITATAITIFPNPVMSYATMEISSTPQSPVSIIIVDQGGNKMMSTNDILDSDGYWKKDWDLTGLRRGIYFVQISLNNKNNQ